MTDVRRSKRVWIYVVVGLVLLFFAQRLAFPADDADEATASDKVAEVETVQRVAQRVEEIRGLKFKEIPEVKVVTEKELAEEQEKAASDTGPTEDQAAKQAEEAAKSWNGLLKLTGLVPSDFDLTDPAAGGGGGGELYGLYEPKTNAVRLVREAVEDKPELAESTLAHELTHAVEVQNYGDDPKLYETSERADGLQSLGEGSATVVEAQYAKRHLGFDGQLREFLQPAGKEDPKVPDILEESVAFPYRYGGLFVDSLLRDEGGNSFDKVDEAWKRPPESSAEILHPELWKKNVKPEKVKIDASLGDGWEDVGGTDFGEFDTALLMRLGATPGLAREAADGWNGGSFELFTKGGGECTEGVCRDKQAAAIGWRWLSENEAAEHEKWIEPYMQKTLKPASGSDGSWKLKDDGFAVYVRKGDASGLAFAPDEETARELAEAATD